MKLSTSVNVDHLFLRLLDPMVALLPILLK
ncbi:hypothetical protein P5673_023149 [Acropora cervicornis]|uniref:Uncharacterized protein n=1 Tax=Acropora cervicornis TaxID=6130 RepID=A0AAD9Q5M0_ACRCE|nr:hypothetical protein P5673_023149 [Acropora cervicornis]